MSYRALGFPEYGMPNANVSIDLIRQRSPSVGIVRNEGIGSVLWTSYLLMLGNAEVLRKDRILPFAFVSIDV